MTTRVSSLLVLQLMKRPTQWLTSRAGVITLVGVSILIALVYGWKMGGNPTVARPVFQPTLPEGSKEKLQADAELCLRDFWRTEKYEGKLQFVRNSMRVAPLMRTYYVEQQRRDPEKVALQSTATLTIGTNRLVHFIFKGMFAGGRVRRVEVAVIEESNGAVSLDWESYVGMGNMDWTEFRKQRPTKPVKLRAYLTPGKYYNYEFENRQRFAAVQLENAEGDQILHAYCYRDSEDYLKIAAMLQRNEGQPSPVTVLLAFPSKAKSDNCVRLEKLVAESWLVLE